MKKLFWLLLSALLLLGACTAPALPIAPPALGSSPAPESTANSVQGSSVRPAPSPGFSFPSFGNSKAPDSPSMPSAEPTPSKKPTPSTEPTPTPNPEPTPSPEPAFTPFTLAFTGDISIAENYKIWKNAVSKGYTIEDCFSPDILSRMRQADFLVINYESCVSDRGSPLSGKAYTFRTSTQRARDMLTIGADLAGLANNHVYDYGKTAFLDTIDTFRQMGIPTIGAGANEKEAYAPYYYEQSGVKIAFIAASRAEKNYMTPVATENSPGIAGCYDTALVCAQIKEAKKQADYVIVYVHFGAEYSTTIEKVQRKAAQDFIDAGADLIVGHHAHILQGIEYYKGKPIFYGLGNYLFNSNDQASALLEVTFQSPDELSFKIIPCRQKDCRLVGTEGSADGQATLASLRKLSPGVHIDENGVICEE